MRYYRIIPEANGTFTIYVNEVGIPALDVIRWATKHGAEAMAAVANLGRHRAEIIHHFLTASVELSL